MYRPLVYLSTVRREHYFRDEKTKGYVKYNPSVQTLTLVTEVPQVECVLYRYMGMHEYHHVYMNDGTYYRMIINDGCGPPPSEPTYALPGLDWPATDFDLRRMESPPEISIPKKTYSDIQLVLYSDGIAEYHDALWTFKWRKQEDGIDLYLVQPDTRMARVWDRTLRAD